MNPFWVMIVSLIMIVSKEKETKKKENENFKNENLLENTKSSY